MTDDPTTSGRPRRAVSPPIHMQGAFGADRFGRRAEAFARFFGTPRFLIGQTILVFGWILANVLAATNQWDPYPFILLNLAFSLQAAYAAPLILLAQTRQADRERAQNDIDSQHREELADATNERQELIRRHTDELLAMIEANTRLTERVEALSVDILTALKDGPRPARA